MQGARPRRDHDGGRRGLRAGDPAQRVRGAAEGGRDHDAAHAPRGAGGRVAAVRLRDAVRAARLPRVLDAKGVGPALALGLLSTLSAERLVRAIREKDIATLQSVPRVGRKKAEQLVLDLADKLDGLERRAVAGGPRPEGAGAEDAIRALVSLGYNSAEAEKAVRAALDANGAAQTATELIRAALAKVGG